MSLLNGKPCVSSFHLLQNRIQILSTVLRQLSSIDGHTLPAVQNSGDARDLISNKTRNRMKAVFIQKWSLTKDKKGFNMADEEAVKPLSSMTIHE